MREKDPASFIGVPLIFNLFHRQIVEGLAKIPFPLGFLVRAAAELLYGFRKVTGVNLSRYLFYGTHRKLGRSMKVFISGGAKLDENVGKNLFKFGFTVLEGYGLTEASPLLTLNPLGKPKIGSVGVPVPDVELKLLNVNEEGAGEIVARGPNIMKGYYKRDDLTDDAIKDGWFRTGDIGSIDKDGYLFFKGRLKDIIVLDSGLNIYPKEIEDEYSRAAPIKEICVYEVYPQQDRAEQALWAVVVPDPGFSGEHGGEVKAVKDALKKRFEKISEKLSDYKRISDFFVTFESLPRTVSGKIKRHVIREIYSENYYGANQHEKME
jgi:long-chain acyl-CoA synthetase